MAIVYNTTQNLSKLLDIISHYDSLEDFYDQLSLHDFSRDFQQQNVSPKVKVFTIYKSKGLEFNYVFLPCWTVGLLPFN